MSVLNQKSLLLGCLAVVAAFLGCDASPVVPIPADDEIPDPGTTYQTPGSGGGQAQAGPQEPEFDFGSTSPVHKRGNVYLAGQPAEEDFQKIAAEGVTRVISLCEEGEVSWDEKAAVEAAGMTFYHFPVASPDDLTPELFDQVRALLAESDDNPTLLHCKGAVRAEAAYIPYAAVDRKAGLEGVARDVPSMTPLPAKWRDKAMMYAKELLAKPAAEAPEQENSGE